MIPPDTVMECGTRVERSGRKALGGEVLRTAASILLVAALVAGCSSTPRKHTDSTDDTTFDVEIVPLDSNRYQMIATLTRIKGEHSRNTSRTGVDVFNFPTLVATLDGDPAEVTVSETAGSGPSAWLVVSQQGRAIVAEYELGYGDGVGSTFSKGRMVIEPR
jgi:hypothetical protein